MPISPHTDKSTNVRFIGKLKDDQTLFIRKLQPGDEFGLNEGFQRLSDNSRYNRFLGIKKKLSRKELAYLCNPDDQTHFALLAYTQDQGIGVARCVRDAKKPDQAELAVTVIDPFHNKGAGTLLFHHLKDIAFSQGITQFIGYAMSENRKILNFVSKQGATSDYQGDGVMKITIPLNPSLHS